MAITGSVWFVVLGLLALVLAAGAALAWLIRAAASTVGESVGESVASAVVAVVQEGLQSTDPSVVATCLGLEVSRGRLSTDQAVERMMSRKLARGATPESHRYFKEGLEQLQAAAGDDPARVLFQALLTLAHAQALSEIGRQAEAKDLLDAALPFVLQHGSPSLRIFALMNHGALLSRLNQPEQALDRVSEALELARHEGQSALIAECLIARGDGLRGVGRWDDALKDFEESLEILRHEDLPDELSKCLTRRGGMLLLREQPTEALHDFDEALPLLRDHGRPEELARCSMNRALAMSQVGLGAEALADYDRILPLVREHGGPDDSARFLMNRGLILEDLGRTADALADFGAALDELGTEEAPELRAQCLLSHGIALKSLGRYREALAEFDAALPLLRARGSRTLLSYCLSYRGLPLQLAGHHAPSLREIEEAVALVGEDDFPTTRAMALQLRGKARRELGQDTEALADYNNALRLFEKRASPELRGHCLMSRAGSLFRLGRLPEAWADYDRAVELLRPRGQARILAVTLVARGTLHATLKEFEAAEADFDEALDVFRRAGIPREVATCLLGKADALLEQDRPGDAVAAYEQIDVALLSQNERYFYHYGHARALKKAGRRADALRQFDRARHAFRRSLRDEGVDETSIEFVRQRRQLAHDAIICATELGDLASAFDALQDAKASLLGDLRRRLSASPLLDSDAIQLARPRLNQWLRDGESPESAGDPGDDAPLAAYLRACRLARPPDPVEADQPIPSAQDFLESVQRALPPDWALLDFWVLSEAQTWVFVVRPDRPVEFVDINSFISNAALLAVNQFHHRLRSPYAPKTYLPVPDLLPPWEFADDLFEEVFAPLLPYLEGVKGLYLVPHKFWHLVPLHAAWRYDPATKEVVFLSDEFAIAYLSSASLLPQLPRPDPGALIRDVLSLANPARGTPRTLPFADWEAEYLRARLQLPAGRFYAGPDATWDRTADWGGCTLVHFACHGLGDTKFAPLSRLELRDDFLLAHDVVHRRPALSEGAVVILNGCQTAVRDLREVDEGMGLMTAFLLRGAGLVLGTLWNVPDDCAAEMVTTFVTELVLQEKSPTEALQQAQRRARQLRRAHLEQRSGELRSRFAGEPRSAEGEHLDRLIELVASRTLSDHPEQDADPENDHPYDDPAFWAAFVLVGRVA